MNAKQLSNSGGPAALVFRQSLTPVEGADGVFFPATFAASEDGKYAGGYNIDELGKDAQGNTKNVCLVDTVGSQANRIEPMFAEAPYAELVPQIVVKAGEKSINLLHAGHRAADAIVRCSELQNALHSAFKALQAGDAAPLAKMAPTSLVFGVWDSRDTQAKAPRLLSATIRAFDVAVLTRSAQYVPATEYVAEALVEEPLDKKQSDLLSSRGFKHVPAPRSHGGVMARGEIRREVTLQLAALRTLRSRAQEAELREYILGLALVAFTAPAGGYLRQGCNLVPAKPAHVQAVGADGARTDFVMTHEEALKFAQTAAAKFGVGENRDVQFDKELAKKDLAPEASEKKSKKSKPTK